MTLRNKTGEFREEKFFEQHYEMPTIIIKITIVLYSIIGLGAVGITLKNESTKIFDEITSAKTIVIEFTEKVEDGNTGIKRDEVGSNKKNNSITAITCYDYAEVYAEKYKVNAGLLRRIIEAFPEDYKTAIALAKAESGLEMTARNYNNNGSMDCGIFQINSIHKPTQEQCNEIDAHLELARKIYDDREWSAWCSYKNKKYLEYL